MGNSFLKVKYFFVICEFRSGREDRSPVGDVERGWGKRKNEVKLHETKRSLSAYAEDHGLSPWMNA